MLWHVIPWQLASWRFKKAAESKTLFTLPLCGWNKRMNGGLGGGALEDVWWVVFLGRGSERVLCNNICFWRQRGLCNNSLHLNNVYPSAPPPVPSVVLSSSETKSGGMGGVGAWGGRDWMCLCAWQSQNIWTICAVDFFGSRKSEANSLRFTCVCVRGKESVRVWVSHPFASLSRSLAPSGPFSRTHTDCTRLASLSFPLSAFVCRATFFVLISLKCYYNVVFALNFHNPHFPCPADILPLSSFLLENYR